MDDKTDLIRRIAQLSDHGDLNHLVYDLVKVARGAADFLADGAADECDVADALREALKPFEK
jgi:hypothetical protein